MSNKRKIIKHIDYIIEIVKNELGSKISTGHGHRHTSVATAPNH